MGTAGCRPLGLGGVSHWGPGRARVVGGASMVSAAPHPAATPNIFNQVVDILQNPAITFPDESVNRSSCQARRLGFARLMSSRRAFLAGFSTAAAVVLASPVRALGRSFDSGRRASSLDELTFSDLAGQVRTRFRVHAGRGRAVELELMRATLDPKRPQHGSQPAPDADNERFSLFFCGRRDECLDGKPLKFEHDQLGSFELVVLPIFSGNTDQINYQAVFNRPRKQGQIARLIQALRSGMPARKSAFNLNSNQKEG